jgi:hypothetical protein
VEGAASYAVIRVDDVGNTIETDEHAEEFKET